MKPDFNRLHVFYQVYRLGSVAQAAGELFVTQSAVSQSLQKLEDELSLALFHRYPKKLVPTEAARRLFQSVMPFFSSLDETIQSIYSAEEVPKGMLRIGAPPVFGAEFLPAVIAEFREKYPCVTFYLVLEEQAYVAAAYRNGELDVALVDVFGNREEEAWNLRFEPLVDEQLILVGSSRYVSQRLGDTLSVESLAACDFIAYKVQAPELLQWFMHHFAEPVELPGSVLTVESVYAVINAVRNHVGLGIVPRYLVQQSIDDGVLTMIQGGTGEVRSRISLLRHEGRYPGCTEKLFIELLKTRVNVRYHESR